MICERTSNEERRSPLARMAAASTLLYIINKFIASRGVNVILGRVKRNEPSNESWKMPIIGELFEGLICW